MFKKSDHIIAFIAVVTLVIVIALRLFSFSTEDDSTVASVISKNIQQELIEIKSESEQILTSNNWNNLSHSFFLVEDSRIVKWNNNDFLPDLRIVSDSVKVRWMHTSRGDFLIDRIYEKGNVQLIAVMQLIEQFKISNDFLNIKWNDRIFPFSGIQIIDPSSTGGLSVEIDQSLLFQVVIPASIERPQSVFTLLPIFWWLGIILLLYILMRWSLAFHQSGKSEFGFSVLVVGLAFLRLSCVYLNFPNFYSGSSVFDPRVFASSSLNPSIGDLLLNTLSILALCLYVFYTYNQWKIIPFLLQLQGIKRDITLVCLASFNFFIVVFPFLYFETIFHNSSISLDITQSLQFDWVRVIAFVCVILSSIASFCFSHVFLRLFLNLSDQRTPRVILFLLIGAVIFIFYFLLLERNYWITLSCALIYFLVVYFFRLANTLKHLSYRTFFYLLATIFLFSIQSALSIERFVEERKINSQFRFANEFLVGRDYLGEFLLNEAVTKIKNDPFVQSSLSNPFLSKASIKQKVRQIYLNNYFDRYDVSIHLYNSSGEPLDTEPSLNFASQVQSYQDRSGESSYQGIYYTTGSSDQDRKYLVVVAVERASVPAGFVVLELSMKKLIPRNVYPELLVDNRFADFRNREFSFAVYSKSKIISSSGEFNYERDFNNDELKQEQLYLRGETVNDFIHVGVEDENDRVAIVSSRSYPFFYLLGNFSLWIVLGFVFVLLGLAVQGIYYWTKRERINYSARVQLYFYSSLLLPLLVVSITTLSIITRSAADQLNQEFIDKSKLLSESLTPDLIDDNPSSREDFGRKLREIAQISDVDATVYDSTGFLIGSSQPLIFEYQFKSELIDHEALDKVVKQKELSFVKKESIGSLNYYSAFSAIRSPVDGRLLGIVSLPFFGSASSLERTQINILANILSIFTAVLLLFSVLSLLAADQLTYPLRIISQSLSRTTLTGHNEPLAWNSNDEIGVMVNEYNRMVKNLEQSKIELARSQKESAWREMAKQVAHEIKNPLTPMKLSLQQMESLLRSEEGLPKDRAERSVKTMLTQVEILNEIASSFSTFARMPTPVMTKVELNGVLKKIIDLYANNDYGNVNWVPSAQPVYVMGDDQLLARIFSNIILNGLQSGGENKTIVNVTLTIVKENCLVVIEDNGSGIPQELIDKIFVPYFSTKKSGSGLGLAIVKQGIEQSGGAVSLESKEGKGTIFYVQFPIVK